MEIKFLSPNKLMMEVREKPVPAANMIPQWWKEMPVYVGNKKSIDLNPQPNVTAKRCFPLLDGISAGYIMPLWADILVEQQDGGPYIKWNTSDKVVEAWSWEQSSSYEIPDGFDKTVFKYLHGWVVKTPPGYSCLITHPIGYNNLPIKTLSGIIDSDSLDTFANSPFIVKSGFEGIIEKGTPMFQIIPFKRDSWKSSFDVMDDLRLEINTEKLRTKIISYYGRYKRKNKKFE